MWYGCTEEGVKMENQKKLLLIRPSRTPKNIPNKNFCPQSFPSMGTSTWLSFCDFSCDFSKILHNFHKTFSKQPRFIWMGHESIHLSLALTLAQFCVTFSRFLGQVCECLHKLCRSTSKFTHKNHVLAPIVGKDLEQNWFLGLFLEAIEGLINKGFIFIFYFHPLLGSV